MKKILSLIICVLVAIQVTSGCETQETREEREHMEYLNKKLWYSSRVGGFMTDAGYGTEKRFNDNRKNPNEESYVDIVFVHSAEEAIGFPDNVLVAWPRPFVLMDGIDRAETLDDVVDWGSFRSFLRNDDYIRGKFPDIDYRDFGLPEDKITHNDIVENWEIVAEIIIHGRGGPLNMILED